MLTTSATSTDTASLTMFAKDLLKHILKSFFFFLPIIPVITEAKWLLLASIKAVNHLLPVKFQMLKIYLSC